METLKLKREDAKHALATLQELHTEEYSTIVRDATIQRFEYTFEACWKFVQGYLRVKEGKICNSPKSCFRELFSAGLLSETETETLLDMTDKRNLTSHTYKEQVAQIIFTQIDIFKRALQKVMDVCLI